MKKYVIINIEQNVVQPEGKVLIVKANEVKRAAGFEHLEQMFGKTYYNYAMSECDETEVFMLPFSEEHAQRLVQLARRHKDCDYWTPNMKEFMNARLSTPKGIITIHKSTALIRKKMRSEAQTYIPPVADWEFKHKVVDGIKIVSFSATKTTVRDTPNGGFSWDSGDMAFFVFPDDEENIQMLNDAIKLDPHKRQFWIPDPSDFYHARISMSGYFGPTEHDLYISHGLPKDSILDNLQEALW